MRKKVVFGKDAIKAFNQSGKAVDLAPAMNLAGGTVNIMIWGEISDWWGVNSRDVYWALKDKSVSQINVFISSPGGEIDQAFIIHDMLKGHPATVTCYLVGQCASSATIIACAGDQVIMSNQCIYMIHKPSWICWGDANEMRKTGEILDKYQSLVINVYKRKTKMPENDLNALMDQETWFEPSEALALGFIDKVVDYIEVDFLLPTTGAAADATQQEEANTVFDNVNTYRSVAIDLLSKGVRPANKADIRAFSRKKSTTMFNNDFFTKILNFLSGEKALAKNVDIEDLAETMSGNEDLTSDLNTEAIAAVVKNELGKVKPQALKIEDLVMAVEKAGDEDKNKIAAALNIEKPAASKAKAKNVKSDDEDEDEDSDEDEDEDDAVSAMQKQITGLLAEVAKMKKGGKSEADTNGASSIKTKPGKEGKITNKMQLEIANKAYKSRQITAEVYENITGLPAPSN